MSKVPAPFLARPMSSRPSDSSVAAMCRPPTSNGRSPRLAMKVETRALASGSSAAMNASRRPPRASTGPKRVLNAFTTCASDDEELNQLAMHVATRNLLVHSDGIVDEKFRKQVPDAAYAVGSRVIVTDKQLDEAD